MAFVEVKKIDENVYSIFDITGVGQTLFVGENKALLFDTGMGYFNLIPYIKKITSKPLIVLNSHAHFDHAGGNNLFSEVYINKKEIEQLQNNLINKQSELILKQSNFLQKFFINILKLRLPKPLDTNFKAFPDNMEFDIGGTTLKLMELPGHTMGSTMLLDERNKTVYTGDAINRNTWLFTNPTYKLERYIKNLEILLKRDNFEYIWCSHDKEKISFDFINYYINFLKNINYENSKKVNFPDNYIEILKKILNLSKEQSEKIVIYEHKEKSDVYGDVAIFYSNYNI